MRSQVSLTSVFSRFVKVTPFGEDGNHRCICPFHMDHNPSMQINEQPGYYYCFSCGATGSFVDLLAHQLQLPSKEICRKVSALTAKGLSIDSWLDEVTSPAALQLLPPVLPMKAKIKQEPIAGPAAAAAAMVKEEEVLTVPSSRSSRQRVLSALELAAAYYTARLFTDPLSAPLRDYLRSRCISPSTASAFRLGYAPMARWLRQGAKAQAQGQEGDEQWAAMRHHTLTSYLLSNASTAALSMRNTLRLRRRYKDSFHSQLGQQVLCEERAFDAAEVIDAGLSINSSASASVYDRFRNRLMVPITDSAGEVIAFGGRELPEHVSRAMALLHGSCVTNTSEERRAVQGKYINSPSSAVFQKKACLFGTHQAAPYCQQTSSVLIVEGYFDVLSLHEVGLRHAVASMGTALSLQQILAAAQLVPGNSSIVLLLDNDAAGQAAAERVKKIVAKCQQTQAQAQGNGSRTVTIKTGSWSVGIEFILKQQYTLRGTVEQELPVVCPQDTARGIKDCGDICTLFDPADACKIMRFIESSAEEVCKLQLPDEQSAG